MPLVRVVFVVAWLLWLLYVAEKRLQTVLGFPLLQLHWQLLSQLWFEPTWHKSADHYMVEEWLK